ncbi:MAG TPA: hypothetical protein VNG33_05020 [Polyangiaceae bacterium]|nr:hypothetical protein [Polyangiaceae bacterium]
MTYKLVLLGGAAASLLAVAGYSLWPARAPRPTPTTGGAVEAPVRAATNDAESTRLQNDLSNLRSQVKDVRSQLSMVQADLNQRAAAVQQPDPPASPEEQRAKTQERRHAHLAEVAASFEREQHDAVWAPSTTTFVQEKLKGVPALSGAGPIDCRTSMCRFEVDPNQDGFDKQLPVFLHSLGDTLPNAEADYQVVNGKGHYTFFLKDNSRAPTSEAK